MPKLGLATAGGNGGLILEVGGGEGRQSIEGGGGEGRQSIEGGGGDGGRRGVRLARGGEESAINGVIIGGLGGDGDDGGDNEALFATRSIISGSPVGREAEVHACRQLLRRTGCGGSRTAAHFIRAIVFENEEKWSDSLV
ncbi:uncharacterized protein LOC112523849 [Cynara cardunculus var. scolymus]|uniref:uncharacterized protein LOC112523849 n=1 Tax=Cynara cardunculus var. scolymus TaxID=59895 RepID=UPI000D6238EE|nr:uncharacterized protein LOC112523849 [Cynara cardunculus var. scolymus]